MKKICFVFIVALKFIPCTSIAAEQVVRSVAPPNHVNTIAKVNSMVFSQVFGGKRYDHNGVYLGSTSVPKNTWNLTARYQGQDAVKSNVSFDPAFITGVNAPLSYRKGKLAGTATPQTTYQLHGYNVGMLNFSWDYDGNTAENHPAYIYCPSNPSNCRGVNKHVAYSYLFEPPVKVFTNPNDLSSSIAIQSDAMKVGRFMPEDRVNVGGFPPSPVGQYYWVVFIKDSSRPSNPLLQLVIAIFQNEHHNGEENIGLEYIGNYVAPYFISSMQRGAKKFTDVRQDSALDFRTQPWAEPLFSRVHITPKNLKSMIGVANQIAEDKCPANSRECQRAAFNNGSDWCDRKPSESGQYSCNLSNYRLTSVGLLQEIQYERGDIVQMGSSAYAPAVYELRQY